MLPPADSSDSRPAAARSLGAGARIGGMSLVPAVLDGPWADVGLSPGGPGEADAADWGVDVPDPPGVTIRTFAPGDHAACRKLYTDGLLGGSICENDSGLDIDDIEMAYLRDGNHFWVAVESPPVGKPDGYGVAGGGAGGGEVVGMIGVQRHEQGVGEIRRLRVRPDRRRRGIGAKLLEAAIRFCHERDYLKVNLDTFIEREPAVRLFEKFRFHHGRTKQANGKQMIEFYLDLYGGERRK